MLKLKYLKTFNEKMGIIPSLEILANEVLSKIKGKEYVKIETDYLNKPITLNVYYSDRVDDGELAYFQIIDEENMEFKIVLSEYDLYLLIHELKHLDYVVRRNFIGTPYHNINHVGRRISKYYKHLFSGKENYEIITKLFYYCDPNEFEAYYHNIYFELKDNLKKIDEDKQRDYITNYLTDQNIYHFYDHFHKNGFDIKEWFPDNMSINEYFDKLIDLLNQWNNTDEIIIKPILQIFKSKVKKILNYFIDDDDISNEKAIKEINSLINKQIKKGFKKFHKIYPLLLYEH